MTLRLPEPPHDLVAALRDGQAVAFVGSGLSIAAGGPSWRDLLMGIAFEAEQLQPGATTVLAEALKALDEEDFLTCASRLKAILAEQFHRAAVRQIKSVRSLQLNEAAFRSALNGESIDRLFHPADEPHPRLMRPTRAHLLLLQLPFRVFITTNYDRLLEEALPLYSDIGVFSRSFRYLPNRIRDSRFILKLHGDIHHIEDIVLDRDDYDAVLEDDLLQQSLRGPLQAMTPFWIGYGHSDPHLNLLLDYGQANLHLPGGYAVIRPGSEKTERRLRQAGIFPSHVEHENVADYLQLIAVRLGTDLTFQVIFEIAWPGLEEARRIAGELARSLSAIGHGECRVSDMSQGSMLAIMVAPAETIRALTEKLHAEDRDLLRVLERYRVVTLDGLPSDHWRRSSAPLIDDTGETGYPVERVQSRIEKELDDGQVYQMTFLSIDIVRHSAIVKTHPMPLVKQLLDNFRSLVRRIVLRRGGDEINWAGDGGIFAFWGEQMSSRSVLAGLSILHRLPLFNIDESSNPLPVTLDVRLAAASSLVEFRKPTNIISADGLNRAAHLQETGTEAGEYCVTDSVLSGCTSRITESFRYKNLFDGTAVYSFSVARPVRRLGREQLESMFEAMESQVETVLGAATDVSAGSFEAISSAIDQAYSTLDSFCRVASDLDENWAPSFFAFLGRGVARFQEMEARLWEALEQRYVEGSTPHPMLAVAGGKRAALVPRLKRLHVALGKRSSEIVDAAPGEPLAIQPRTVPLEDGLLTKIKGLTDPDALNPETAFADIMASDKVKLVAFLTGEAGDQHPKRRELARSFWKLADLVLLEDASEKRAGAVRLTAVLEQDPDVGRFFQTIGMVLFQGGEDSGVVDLVHQRLGGWSREDLEIFWRCVLVAYPDQEVRERAARETSLGSLWRALAYAKVPMAVVAAVARRIRMDEDDDNKKIFFDCVRARMVVATAGTRSIQELNDIKRLLMMFLRFNFFVESGYFERLDDLLLRYKDKAKELGEQYDLLSDVRDKLQAEWEKLGRRPTAVPASGKLPKPVQRILAGEPPYVYIFAPNENALIAREVLPNITPANVQRVLANPEINSFLMADILKQENLFKRTPAVIAALGNPKVTGGFVQRHLPGLLRSQDTVVRRDLARLAASPNVASHVRSLLAGLKLAR